MEQNELIKNLVSALETTLAAIKSEIYDDNKYSLRRDYGLELDVLKAAQEYLEKQ